MRDQMARFLEILRESMAVTAQVYPDARLIEAHGAPSSGVACTEDDVDNWRFLFLGPVDADHATTIVLEYRAPTFGSPILRREPFWSTGTIRLGLKQAIGLKNDAGKTEPFQRVNLRLPFSSGSAGEDEPFYIFGSISSPFVFVGTETGAVTTLDAKYPRV
jgi:hypothetical protein